MTAPRYPANLHLHSVDIPGHPLVRVAGMRGKFKAMRAECNQNTGAAWVMLFGPVAKGDGQYHHVRPERVRL